MRTTQKINRPIVFAALIGAAVLVFLIAFFWAGGAKRQISGRIVATKVDDATGGVSFVVQTEDGQEIGVLLSDETMVFSFLDGFPIERFQAGLMTDTLLVSADLGGARESLAAEDGKTIPAYYADQVEVTGDLRPDPVRLPDGTTAEVWQYVGGTAYILPDGTELLRVNTPTGPGHVSVGGVEGLDELPEEAQTNILRFYQDQGLLYDQQAQLEKAYEDYCRAEEPAAFQTHLLDQEISPTASSDTVIYFQTSVSLPVDGTQMTSLCAGAAFEKKTGDPIAWQDLFSCPPEEIPQTLMEIAQITDPVLWEEIKTAFDPQWMCFFPEHLAVSFPQGTLPSEAHSLQLDIAYEERLLDILQPWAVPTHQTDSQ